MKLELNLDQATIGPTVQELFSSLTIAERKEVSRQILVNFLTEPHGGERAAYEANLVAELKASDSEEYSQATYGRKKLSEMSEPQIRGTDLFKKRLETYRSSRDVMLAEITKVAVETYRAEVTHYVQNDPQLQAALKITLDAVKEDFPKFVHDAMVGWFITSMQQQGTTMMSALYQAQETKMVVNNLEVSLRSRGVLHG